MTYRNEMFGHSVRLLLPVPDPPLLPLCFLICLFIYSFKAVRSELGLDQNGAVRLVAASCVRAVLVDGTTICRGCCVARGGGWGGFQFHPQGGRLGGGGREGRSRRERCVWGGLRKRNERQEKEKQIERDGRAARHCCNGRRRGEERRREEADAAPALRLSPFRRSRARALAS